MERKSPIVLFFPYDMLCFNKRVWCEVVSESGTRLMLDGVDGSINRSRGSGRHTSSSTGKDLDELIKRAVQTEVFTRKPFRQYDHFKNFERDPFKNLDLSALYSLINQHKRNICRGNKARWLSCQHWGAVNGNINRKLGDKLVWIYETCGTWQKELLISVGATWIISSGTSFLLCALFALFSVMLTFTEHWIHRRIYMYCVPESHPLALPLQHWLIFLGLLVSAHANFFFFLSLLI